MPHGYGGYTGNGLLTSMTFLIFTLIRTKQKGISKKDMWNGWSAVNTENFIRNGIMEFISFETKEDKDELNSLSKDAESSCCCFMVNKYSFS